MGLKVSLKVYSFTKGVLESLGTINTIRIPHRSPYKGTPGRCLN